MSNAPGTLPFTEEKRELLKGEVIQLRTQGLSYRKVAAKLGISPTEAFVLQREALKEIKAMNAGMTEEYRELELASCDEHLDILAERLDIALAAGDDEKINKNLDAVDKIRKRIIQLRQLDGKTLNFTGGLEGTMTVKREQRVGRIAELMRKAAERRTQKEKPIATTNLENHEQGSLGNN